MSTLKVDSIESRTSGNRVVLPDTNNYPPFRNIVINGDMKIGRIESHEYDSCDNNLSLFKKSSSWQQIHTSSFLIYNYSNIIINTSENKWFYPLDNLKVVLYEYFSIIYNLIRTINVTK